MHTGWPKKGTIFTALHGMQTRSSNEISVCLSVKRVHCDKMEEKSVAFKTLDISQGSVATHLRCGGMFSDSIITIFFLILTVK